MSLESNNPFLIIIRDNLQLLIKPPYMLPYGTYWLKIELPPTSSIIDIIPQLNILTRIRHPFLTVYMKKE